MAIAQKMAVPLSSGFGFWRKGPGLRVLAIREVTPVKVHLLGAALKIRLWDGERWKEVTLT